MASMNEGGEDMTHIQEAARATRIADRAQVIVCGGGPAGVCAAIAATRQGADTLLIERGNCLGGIWTSGLLSWILDNENKQGILREILSALERAGKGYYGRGHNFITLPEPLKLLLESLCREAGVRLLYHAQVCGAQAQDNRMDAVICESKEGRAAYRAAAFVDATGDGDLSYYAGCGFDLGKPETGELQPMSLIALVDGVDAEAARAFNNTLPYLEGQNAKKLMQAEMRGAGVDPSYDHPSLFHVQDGLWLMMTTHAYGADPFSADSLTPATLQQRQELHAQVEALRARGGVWKNLRLVATAPSIGVREGRRIHGRYTVTWEDAVRGARFDDAICRVNFGFDIHPLRRENSFEQERRDLRSQPYDIPLRALQAKDVEGLYLAGRCISGDFYAHSSYRVTGDAAAMGEAAGQAAAREALARA